MVGGGRVGIIVGPTLGCLLLTHFWWCSVFLINVPLVALATVGVILTVPETAEPGRHRLDLLGAVALRRGPRWPNAAGTGLAASISRRDVHRRNTAIRDHARIPPWARSGGCHHSAHHFSAAALRPVFPASEHDLVRGSGDTYVGHWGALGLMDGDTVAVGAGPAGHWWCGHAGSHTVCRFSGSLPSGLPT